MSEDHNSVEIKDKIKQITDGLARDRGSVQADKARGVASALGTETPATVLPDIRDVNARMLCMLEEMRNLQIETERNAATRHKEMCVLLTGVLNSGPKLGDAHTSYSPATAATNGKEQYYYGSTSISSGVHVVACVAMHMDILLSEHPQFQFIQSTDNTFMDMKDWYNLTSYALNADKSSKAGLRIPKPSDEDFKAVCRMLAASAAGRRPRCQVSNLSTLLAEAPGVMNTVEWVRSAIIRCKGVLSPEREFRFRHVSHPFINEDMDLQLAPQKVKKLPNRSFHRGVCELKITQKKEYMNLILERDMQYMDAFNKVAR